MEGKSMNISNRLSPEPMNVLSSKSRSLALTKSKDVSFTADLKYSSEGCRQQYIKEIE